MTFTPGENVGPYRIIEQLGQGGMATVFKAYHAALDRYVAIKVLHPAFKQDPNFLARFQREARIVANLEHPNIVPVYDFNEHRGAPYLVMRYIEGKTLKEQMHGPVSIEEALSVLRPVCEALAYAHGQNVLHRDIKPSNVILANDGHLFLADFGLARIAQSGESSLTKDMLVGTPQYISPEQAKGVSDLDARTDIYSLTVVLFELLTGRVPFSADTPYAVIHDHIFSPLPLPRSINPNISPEVEKILLKGLAKERDDRFSGVGEMLVALEQSAKQADTVAAPPLPPPPLKVLDEKKPEAAPVEEKRSFLQRYRWPLLGGLAVFLLLCCLASIIPLQRIINKERGRDARSEPTTDLSLLQAAAPPEETPATETPIPAQAEPLAEAETDNVEAKAHVQVGDELVKAGSAAGAIEEYEQAIKLDPKLSEAYIKAGDLLMYDLEENRLKEALKMFESGLAEKPNDSRLHLKAGEALTYMGRYSDAVPHLERATELTPRMALAHALLAVCHFRMADPIIARRELKVAEDLDPKLPEVHLIKGLLSVKERQVEDARRELQMVLDLPESNPRLRKVAGEELKSLESLPSQPDSTS